MYADEVRLGDLVSSCNYGRGVVRAVLEDGQVLVDNGIKCSWVFPIKVNPIRIVKTMLILNGFKQAECNKEGCFEQHFIDSSYVSLFPMLDEKHYFVEIENHSANRYFKGCMMYVHELQHQLKECQIDLELKLK